MSTRKKKRALDPRMQRAAVAASHISEFAREEYPDLSALSMYEKRLHVLVEELRHEDGQRTQTALISTQRAYIDELHKVIQWEQAQCRQRDEELAKAVSHVEACARVVAELVKLCQLHGIAIPGELMGGTLQ